MAGPGLPESITEGVTTGHVTHHEMLHDLLNEFDTTEQVNTKGDLLVFDGTTIKRLPIGADDTIATADAAEALGIKWGPAGGGGGSGPGSGATLVGTSTAGGGSPLSFTVPAGTQDGDLCIIAVQFVNSVPNVNGPEDGGWNEALRFDTSSNEWQVCYWKIADGSEPSAWTFTHSAGTDVGGAAAVYRGVNDLFNSGFAIDTLVIPPVPAHPAGLQVCVWLRLQGADLVLVPLQQENPIDEDVFFKNAGGNTPMVMIAHRDTTSEVDAVWGYNTGIATGFTGALSLIFIDT